MAVINAASLSSTDVQSAMNAASAGDTVQLPAGSANWTSGVSWTAPANITILGAGSLTTLGGGNATVIVNMTTNPNLPLLLISVNNSGVFRIAGITFREGPYEGGRTADNAYKNHAVVLIVNDGLAEANVRFDHNTFDAHTYPINTHAVSFTGWIKGVADNNQFNFYAGTALYFYNQYRIQDGRTDYGNQVWTEEAQFGTDSFFFIEDNYFLATTNAATRMGDSNGGAKVVWRFNTFEGSSGLELHGIGHTALGDRGPRAQEGYGNYFKKLVDQDVVSNPPQTMTDGSGGGALFWGNESDLNNVKNGHQSQYNRINDATYIIPPTPNGWGHCSGPETVSTVNVDATGLIVTKTGGADFNVAWPVGHAIYIVGAVCDNGGAHAPGPVGRIASVESATSLTLQNASTAGVQISTTATVGSRWDGNTDVYGYPGLDQPGRGRGQLMSGDPATGSLVNDDTGIISHLNQESEPMYYWKNVATPHPGYGGFLMYPGTTLIVSNRDFYAAANSIQTSPTSPFDGTVGCGWGTLANRPTTCTVGVAYFVTDQGSWNHSISNPYGVQQNGANGVLYKATATNTWTLYYTPYTYPHPLNTSETSTSNTFKLHNITGLRKIIKLFKH